MPHMRLKIFVYVFLLLAFCLQPLVPFLSTQAAPSTVNPTRFAANGAINDVEIGPDGTVYLGGAFTYVGAYTGSAVPVDATTGVAESVYPKVSETLIVSEGDPGGARVRAVVPDGTGGWYVGGAISVPSVSVTNPDSTSINNLMHIKSDGTLDAEWRPDARGRVNALFLDGSTLYVGGAFVSGGRGGATIGGAARSYIAAVNTTTGLATEWNPASSLNGEVEAIAVSGTTLYIGGKFTSVGATSRRLAAAFSTVDGSLLDFNPNVSSGVEVTSLATSGTLVYLGGDFSTVDLTSRSNLAAVDGGTGTVTSWNPAPNAVVSALLVSGSSLYVGGSFSTIDGASRNGVAEIDGSGAVTAWDAQVTGTSFSVKSLALNGSSLYLGGSFSAAGGSSRSNVAAVDTSSGTATAWNPVSSGVVNALSYADGTVMIGGNDLLVGGAPRNHLAAIDPSTFAVTSWNPDADAEITKMTIGPSTLYVAGPALTTVGGQSRPGIANVSLSSGSPTAFATTFDETIYSLALGDSTLYVGGTMSTIGGETRNNVAALNASTGEVLTDWDANANDTVQTLVVSGDRLYAGGAFTSIGGQSRAHLAALDLSTGDAVAEWDPSPDAGVQSLAASGTTLYVGGAFASIGGQSRAHLAALSTQTGLATAWNPGLDATVSGIAVQGDSVYIQGTFTQVGLASQNNVAEISATTGALRDWDIGMSRSSQRDIAATDSRVYVVGNGIPITNHPVFALFGPGPTVGFSASASTDTEASSTVSIPVTLSEISPVDVSVHYDISAGTATEGDDFTATSGTLTFPAGATATSVTFMVSNDTAEESGETVVLTLSEATEAFLGSRLVHTYTIADNDTPEPAPSSGQATNSGGGGAGSVGVGAVPPVTPTFQTYTYGDTQATSPRTTSPSGLPFHSLIKLLDDHDPATREDTSIYYVGIDGKRHVFLNAKVYFSWYTDFSGILSISPAQMEVLPLGAAVRHRPGKRLVKSPRSPRVYAIDRDGRLRWIKTEAVAAAVYGSDWKGLVDDEPDEIFSEYLFGLDIASPLDFDPVAVQMSVLFPSDAF